MYISVSTTTYTYTYILFCLYHSYSFAFIYEYFNLSMQPYTIHNIYFAIWILAIKLVYNMGADSATPTNAAAQWRLSSPFNLVFVFFAASLFSIYVLTIKRFSSFACIYCRKSHLFLSSTFQLGILVHRYYECVYLSFKDTFKYEFILLKTNWLQLL